MKTSAVVAIGLACLAVVGIFWSIPDPVMPPGSVAVEKREIEFMNGMLVEHIEAMHEIKDANPEIAQKIDGELLSLSFMRGQLQQWGDFGE